MDELSDFGYRKEVSCPQCKEDLLISSLHYMDVDGIFHCSDCRNNFRVSLYNSRVENILERLSEEEPDGNSDDQIERAWRELETHFLPCPCGGEFKVESPKRCLFCGYPIPTESPYRIISPYPFENRSPEKAKQIQDLFTLYQFFPGWIPLSEV